MINSKKKSFTLSAFDYIWTKIGIFLSINCHKKLQSLEWQLINTDFVYEYT